MGNPFENAVEAPEKRDEMLEGFLNDAEVIFNGLPMAVGVSRHDAVINFKEFFEKNKAAKENFIQNLIDTNKDFHEWLLQQDRTETETETMKVKHGGMESIYDENVHYNTKVDAVYGLIEKLIIEHARKK